MAFAQSFEMTVEVDLKGALRGIRGFEREQLPFAIAKSLTETAKKAQVALQVLTHMKFDLHGEFIPKGIRIKAARKTEVKMGFGNAAVYTAPRISSFMPIHEESGTRKPRGKAIAVPGRALKDKAYRTSTGRIKKRWKPSKLLENWGGSGRGSTGSGGKGKGGKKRAFILAERGSQPAMIVRRKSKRAVPLDILYILIPIADYKAVWDFEETVTRVATAVFRKEFEHALAEAIKTAR